MKIQSINFLFLSVALQFVIACGPDVHDRENYVNVAKNPGAIILNDPQKHMGGYGRNECLVCHNLSLNVHRRPEAMIDVDELNRQIRANGEAKYCLTCHGKNGLDTTSSLWSEPTDNNINYDYN